MSIGTWFGNGWAQPVVKRRWAFAASLLFTISKATGYRVLNGAKGRAHCRAVGTSRDCAL